MQMGCQVAKGSIKKLDRDFWANIKILKGNLFGE